jgi:hypothetical protein
MVGYTCGEGFGIVGVMDDMSRTDELTRRTENADWFGFFADRNRALGRFGSHLVGFGEGFLVGASRERGPEVWRGEEGFWRDFGFGRVWIRWVVGHRCGLKPALRLSYSLTRVGFGRKSSRWVGFLAAIFRQLGHEALGGFKVLTHFAQLFVHPGGFLRLTR